MSFPSKDERTKCWSARDKYWECLDNLTRSSTRTMSSTNCEELRKIYEKSCSPQWVKHFDRKRNYLKYKEKIEKDGYEPINDR